VIPKENSPYYKNAKFAILECGDMIEASDEYYNPIEDKWLPVQKDFIGYEFDYDYSKPVRRKLNNCCGTGMIVATLKQHQELLNQLDISSTLKAILYEGILRNEEKYLTQKSNDNLIKLYEFVVQGSTQSTDDMARSAFATMKYRMELLFPELVKSK
jgi:hypothetical protein